MELKQVYRNIDFVDGGICAAKGFRASGVYCGIKMSSTDNQSPDRPHKNDICLVVSDVLANAAAVYTQNKVKGAPILVTRSNLTKTNGKASAIIANSKNANTCNADGEEKAYEMCRLAAQALHIRPEEVIVASTGVIGQILPIEPIAAAIDPLLSALSYTGNEAAATAIMTTDTVKKEVAVEFKIGNTTCRLGGMGKGSGMIHPNMATTLNFIATDAAISTDLLSKALGKVVKLTYNCLSIDGDTSTNDMVTVMANGMAGNSEITDVESEEYRVFEEALFTVMMNLTRMLAKDGEGATKLLECTVSGAKDTDTAITVAKSIIRSPLLKCAMFGADANWGRILCAIGYADAEFDIRCVNVELASAAGSIRVCENGAGCPFSEEEAKKILLESEIVISVSIGSGNGEATAWGCDLTYDYVKINGDYRS